MKNLAIVVISSEISLMLLFEMSMITIKKFVEKQTFELQNAQHKEAIETYRKNI